MQAALALSTHGRWGFRLIMDSEDPVEEAPSASSPSQGPAETTSSEPGLKETAAGDNLRAEDPSPRADDDAGGEGAEIRERKSALEDALKDDSVDFADVIRLRHWQTGDDAQLKTLGNAYYDRALAAFQQAHGGTDLLIAVFGDSGTGVYLTPDGTFYWTIIQRAIRFDWSEAHELLFRIDAVAEQAREWWLRPKEESGGERMSAQLRPHLDRAQSLTSAILAAINTENLRHRADLNPDDPTDTYKRNLALLRAELERAERLLLIAAQRHAQIRYGAGMLQGTVAIAVFCLVLGAIFYWRQVPAFYAIALPAGAIGALLSVLQRMTSGSLRLDVHAGDKMLNAFGLLRPIVGAAFGMALFALITGGLLPPVEVPAGASPAAFWAGIGFLAGFNERFAQDMLVGSARRISGPAGGSAVSESQLSVATRPGAPR